MSLGIGYLFFENVDGKEIAPIFNIFAPTM